MKTVLAVLGVVLCACATSGEPPDLCEAERPAFTVAAAEELDLFAYDAGAPLNVEVTAHGSQNGVQVSGISFDSPGGGRATGLLFDPVNRSGARPAIVLMHGLPGSAQEMGGWAQVHAELGAVVLALDAPFARRSGNPVRFTAQDRAEQLQLIGDLQRAVDVLLLRPNVDPEAIGYLGVSFGGAMGALFVGVERRLRAAVLVVGDGGLVTHFTGPEDEQFRASLSCETRLAWIESMAPVEPIRFLPHATVPALLLQNGRTDELVPEADGEALHAVAPAQSTLRWYPAGHGLNQQAHVDRHAWLQEALGLDPWP